MDSLLSQLAQFRPFRSLIVGDYMLDQNVHGAAERLSPDAPVPVLHATRFENSPGGSANVARCLRALKGDVWCVGVVGDDSEGRTLRDALQQEGCDVEGLVVDPTRPTTIKRSLIGLAQHRHPQKMFRVDVESREPISESVGRRIVNIVEQRLADIDVVCIEDYNKGVCSAELCGHVIKMCRRAGKPVLVDPAAIEDYSKYRGATAITPNRSEAELATQLDTPIEATAVHNQQMASMLLAALELDAVILTLDKQGAMLALPGQPPLVIPTVARNVYDVSGAGDMVLAALAGAIANRFSWEDAVRFANAAAGLEVEVFGAQPIPLSRVRQSILTLSKGLDGKVRRMDELLIELEAHRESGARVVLTNGCFDVIHAGHIAYLREAAKLGDILVVGVNSDEEVRRQKGVGRPVYSLAERIEILSELESVRFVVTFPESTAHQLIQSIRPHVYVKGGDYLPEDVSEFDILKPMIDDGSLTFHTLGFRPGLSSTQVIDRFARASGDRISQTSS